MLMNKAGADREIEEQPRRQIKVIAPGPQSLVQDGGRPGFQKLGVSVSGAADIDALNVGNRLVGNDPDAAAIEILLGGAEYVFG
jgi:allophanate hydrolase subunit 2